MLVDEAEEVDRVQIVKGLKCQVRSLSFTRLALGNHRLSKGTTWSLLFFPKHKNKNGIIIIYIPWFIFT